MINEQAEKQTAIIEPRVLVPMTGADSYAVWQETVAFKKLNTNSNFAEPHFLQGFLAGVVAVKGEGVQWISPKDGVEPKRSPFLVKFEGTYSDADNPYVEVELAKFIDEKEPGQFEARLYSGYMQTKIIAWADLPEAFELPELNN